MGPRVVDDASSQHFPSALQPRDILRLCHLTWPMDSQFLTSEFLIWSFDIRNS